MGGGEGERGRGGEGERWMVVSPPLLEKNEHRNLQ